MTQYKNDNKSDSIYSVKIKKRNVRSSRILYNLNLRERIRGKREKNKKSL
jgi:hypothetical protein